MSESDSNKLDRILSGIEHLNNKTDKTNVKIEELTEAINKLKSENAHLKNTITMLELKIHYQENQLRRNNVIIYNLEENETETWEQTEHLVNSFVQKYFAMELQTRDIESQDR